MRSSLFGISLIALMGCSSTPVQNTPDAAPDSQPADTGLPDTGPKVEASGALIVGTLAESDLGKAQMQHDALAAGGQTQATMAGDIGHAAFLGTKLLGTKENEYLALDRWVQNASIDAFYGNPQFAMGFSMFFSAPPSLVVYTKRPTWAQYGTVDSGNDADPHYWVIVRGTLKGADMDAQMTHDAIVAGAKAQAMAAGDVAHVVYTGRDDGKQYLAIDAWKDSTNIETFYSNPQFQAAVANFLTTPTIGVYHSTHWHQW